MRKRKGGNERKQIFDARIYPIVSVGTYPPLVYVVKILLLSGQQISSETPLNLLKGSVTKTHAKSLGHLDAAFTIELPTNKGLLVLYIIPCTKLSLPLHTKPKGRRLADEPRRPQGAGTPRYKL
jgi:hypothetical protein